MSTRRVGREIAFATLLATWTWALLSPAPRSEAVRAVGTEEDRFYFSKLVHVVGYAALGATGLWAFQTRRGRVAVFALLAAHAPLGEVAQGWVGRTPAGRDVLLDWTGVVIGAVIISWHMSSRSGRRPRS